MSQIKNLTTISAEQKNRYKSLNDLFEFTEKKLPHPERIVNELIDGILILTIQGDFVYANAKANKILKKLRKNRSKGGLIPREIWHICHSLIESRNLFPDENWLIESKIFINSSTTFNIRVRWIKLENFKSFCLLLLMEDQKQFIEDIAIQEAQKYNLTLREQEVWLLHQADYTYKQIAVELNITPNTVKKHMKSILTKQRSALDQAES
ncbi:MAG: helix-turn-helix transcriptional regulator [Cyanothece sp. SIO1E1]|nr:helix-turn-helix transcriptional regulator [Cyanothece sp. SIO1E1]